MKVLFIGGTGIISSAPVRGWRCNGASICTCSTVDKAIGLCPMGRRCSPATSVTRLRRRRRWAITPSMPWSTGSFTPEQVQADIDLFQRPHRTVRLY
ncbi:MAG: hypothetical protein R2856_39790 [Caldilineaceae bacterium]